MEISKIKLMRSTKSGSLAFGYVEFDDQMSINVSIMKGKDGNFVSWPGYKTADGKWNSSTFIKDEGKRNGINKAIMDAYVNMGKTDQTPPKADTGSQVNEGCPF